jgi:hypothetical protein
LAFERLMRSRAQARICLGVQDLLQGGDGARIGREALEPPHSAQSRPPVGAREGYLDMQLHRIASVGLVLRHKRSPCR